MPNGFTGRSRSSYSRFKIVVAVIGGLVICHLLSVVITSAQSTAAGGPLILFPLALLWQEDKNQGLSTLIDPTYLQETDNRLRSDNEAIVKVTNVGAKAGLSFWGLASNYSDYNPQKETTIFPNPIRLPVLPKTPPPPPAKKRLSGLVELDRPNSFMQQLRNKRRELERRYAMSQVNKGGISMKDAMQNSRVQNKEAIDVAMLAMEKPENHVKQSFRGGQNGRSLPAPHIFSSLFKKDNRPEDDKSWLDRLTDSLIDKLELRYEDEEEARSESQEERPQIKDVKIRSNITIPERAGSKQWPADECANVLNIPKVAMMILTKGELYHTSTWNLWFKFAEGHLPIAQVKGICSNPTLLEKARKACKRRETGTGEDVLANQHLFNVYIHVGANNQEFKGFGKDTIWHKRDIIDRVQVEWGRHSLVTATRNLMKIALQEPLNQRFILLSEAGIPLYPPTTLYYQLMSEKMSRINSCTNDGWERHPHRWTDAMETPQMKKEHWRKSSQWFGLTRAHAELVIKDTVINAAFHDHCYPTTEDGWWRDCFSDEHYFATLLAVLGKENETDCKGFNVHVDWSRGGAHPRTYELREISAARLRLLRMPTEGCGYPSAIKTSQYQFVKAHDLDMSVCSLEVPEYSNTLGPQCPLLARKFAPDAAEAITQLISECRNRLKIVQMNECQTRLKMFL